METLRIYFLVVTMHQNIQKQHLEQYGILTLFTVPIGGVTKQEPNDFIVEEIRPNKERCTVDCSPKPLNPPKIAEKREYLHFTLVKKNLTTHQAIKQLSDSIGISRKRFGFAGLKDRRALTAQRISVQNVKRETLKDVELKDISLKEYEYTDEPIHRGELHGNRFTITIRQPANPAQIEEVRDTFLKEIKNYFGPQRFGKQRPINHLIGKALMLGRFEKAAKLLLAAPGDAFTEERTFAKKHWGEWKKVLQRWPKTLGVEAALLNYLVHHPTDYKNAFRELPKNLRRLFVHAVQSYLFNRVLSQMSDPPETLPLVGYHTRFSDTIASLMQKQLKQQGISRRDFRCLQMPEIGSRGVQRQAIIYLNDFVVLKKTQNSLQFQFSLPKGAYASLILLKLGVEI